MKNVKKYIILIFCFILVLIIALIILLMQIKAGKHNEEMENGFEFSTEVNNKYAYVSSKSDYFRVKEIVKLYYEYITKLNEKGEEMIEYEVEGEEYLSEPLDMSKYNEEQKQRVKNVLYAMLGKEYVEEYNITLENLEQKLQQYEATDFFINDMYSAEISNNVVAYFVKGYQVKENKLEDFYFMIVIDENNSTFSVYLEDYIKKHELDNYQENSSVTIGITEIENKIYNKTNYQTIGDNEVTKEYFDNYKKLLKYDVTKLFDVLDEDYRTKRFGTLEEFTQYIDINKNKLQNSNIVKYSKLSKGTTAQYICIDQNDNYYIFNETAPMRYTVILDTYTIDLPEFTEKYEKASEEEKVLMNIQKFFMALDAQDYRYAYSKLDETFKANNFVTQAEFETYVRNTFFDKNKLAAGTAEKQNDIYLYKITITDKSGEKAESVSKTFVMQLKEGTDFAMSFSK